jgi:hypothetical protein
MTTDLGSVDQIVSQITTHRIEMIRDILREAVEVLQYKPVAELASVDEDVIKGFLRKDRTITPRAQNLLGLLRFATWFAKCRGFETIEEFKRGQINSEAARYLDADLKIGISDFIGKLDDIGTKGNKHKYAGLYYAYRLASTKDMVTKSLVEIFDPKQGVVPRYREYLRIRVGEDFRASGYVMFSSGTLILLGAQKNTALMRVYMFPSAPTEVATYIDGLALIHSQRRAPFATRIVLRRELKSKADEMQNKTGRVDIRSCDGVEREMMHRLDNAVESGELLDSGRHVFEN